MIRSRLYALAPFAVAAVSAIGVACTDRDEPVGTSESRQTELDQFDWLEKASKVLRAGDGLGPRDDVDALAALSKEAVVDLWMNDPRFGDSVLGFNLFYLGRAVNRVRPNPTITAAATAYDHMVYAWPQAIAAAQAVVSGGDYFQLYAGAPPYARTRNRPFSATEAQGMRASVAAQLDAAITTTASDRTRGCTAFNQGMSVARQRLDVQGYTPAFAMRSWLRPSARSRTVDCETGQPSTEELTGAMRGVRNAVDAIFVELEAKLIPQAGVKSIGDLPTITTSFEGLPSLNEPLTSEGFWTSVPVTSTNFQRKRAAAVLRTYFCDDLTPTSIPSADDGNDGGTSETGAHASNANCQTCHYRLDPIGALFRDIGTRGTVVPNGVRFDDDVFFQGEAYERYLSQWKNPDGGFRAGYWIIGRSGKPEREAGWTDADGDTLEGLWSYLPRSKVVKSCLVRRLAEYVLGPKQVYDREWLAEISSGFERGAGSGEAFKQVVKSLVLSKTFATQDPTLGVCYDAPSDAPPNRSPCAIAHVVSTHCAGCHSSSAGPGHLDFTTWKDLGDGTFSWAHLENGAQLPRAESLRRIRERITTPDREKRMPLMRSLPEEDLATFQTWLEREIEPGPLP
jgi:mono/diheme cytochrome c family protein